MLWGTDGSPPLSHVAAPGPGSCPARLVKTSVGRPLPLKDSESRCAVRGTLVCNVASWRLRPGAIPMPDRTGGAGRGQLKLEPMTGVAMALTIRRAVVAGLTSELATVSSIWKFIGRS